MAHHGGRLALLAGLATMASQAAMTTRACAQEDAAAGRRGRSLSGRPPGKPARLWIWYPDGGNQANTEDGPYCSGLRPPVFTCTFGTSTGDCKRQIQAYLDLWYADFNLVFTLTRPNADYYTIVVTNHGSWCPSPPEDGMAGIAYSSGCNDITGYAGYVFSCDNAHDCATVIAHEHAHMVGLGHTDSMTDIMSWKVRPTANGFDNAENPTLGDTCDYLTQNSYQRMLSTLGAWPGGVKPSPFADLPDGGAPDAAAPEQRDASTSGTPIGPGGPTIDSGPIGVLGGYDAVVRPTLPMIDAPVSVSRPGGGCSHAGIRSRAAWLEVALAGFLFLALTRGAGRRLDRRARPAGAPPPCATPARSRLGARARDRA